MSSYAGSKERSFLYRPVISWGAVFGGWIFAYAFALLLYLLGAAAGLTTMSALNEFSMGATIGTGIWMAIAWIAATAFGAYVAGRLCGRTDKGTGALHGMIVWGFSGVMTLLMASMQIGAVAAAGTNAAQSAAQAGSSLAQGADQSVQGQQVNVPSQIVDSLRQRISGELGQQASQATGGQVNSQEIQSAIQNLDNQTMTNISSRLIQGDTEGAKNILAQQTDLSEGDINALVSSMSTQVRQAGNNLQEQAGDVAEQGTDYASGALWAAFFASLIGLGAGAWGGGLGARRAAKVYGESYEAVTTDVRTDVPPTTGYEERRRAV